LSFGQGLFAFSPPCKAFPFVHKYSANGMRKHSFLATWHRHNAQICTFFCALREHLSSSTDKTASPWCIPDAIIFVVTG